MAIQETERDEKYIKPSVTTDGSFDFDPVDQLMSRDYKQSNIIQLVRTIAPAGTSAPQTKITDGTDLLLVNSDGSINVKSDKPIDVVSGQAVNNTVTLKTVAAGKKVRVYGYDFGISDTAGGTATLTIGTKTFVKRQLAASSRDSSVDFGDKYIEVAAAGTITLTSSAATLLTNASVWFVELDV